MKITSLFFSLFFVFMPGLSIGQSLIEASLEMSRLYNEYHNDKDNYCFPLGKESFELNPKEFKALKKELMDQWSITSESVLKKYYTQKIVNDTTYKVTFSKDLYLYRLIERQLSVYTGRLALKNYYDLLKEKEDVFFTKGIPGCFVSNLVGSVAENSEGDSKDLDPFDSFASLIVSPLVDALTKVISSQIKSDTRVNYMRKFRDAMVKDSSDLKKVFGNTAEVLKLLGDEAVINYDAHLPSIRSSLAKDLRRLDYRYAELIGGDDSDLSKYLNDLSDVGRILLVDSNYLGGFAYLRQLSNNGWPSRLNTTSRTYNLDEIKTRVKESDLTLYSLTKKANGASLVSLGKFQEFNRNEVAKSFFLAILSLRAQAEGLDDFSNHLDSIGKDGTKRAAFFGKLNQILAYSKQLDPFVRTKSSDRKSISYSEFLDNLLRFYEVTLKVKPNASEPALKDYLATFERVLSLQVNLKTRDYQAAILEGRLLQKALGVTVKEGADFQQYSTFIAALVGAADSTDTNELIGRFAKPDGSAYNKRLRETTFGINSYLGYRHTQFFEKKTGQLVDSSGVGQPVSYGSYGSPYLPVGLAYSFKIDSSRSFTVFGSLVDVGAAAAFLYSNVDKKTPNFDLESIWAPGIHLMYNFPKLPLSIGLGAQVAPSLRTVLNNNAIKLEPDAGRRKFHFGIQLAWDIPVAEWSSMK